MRSEAWPDPTNAEELHDALLWLGCLSAEEARTAPGWGGWLEALAREKRVAELKAPRASLWIPAERLNQFRALWPAAGLDPEIAAPAEQSRRGVDAGSGAGRDPARPARGSRAGHANGADRAARARAGSRDRRADRPRKRGRRSCAGASLPGVNDEQWCDRRLLARIHHYTIRRLRSEIDPVAARDFLRFLFAWQHVAGGDAPRRARRAPGGPPVARRLRGAGRGVGDGDPAGAAQGLRSLLARRRMSRRADRLGAAEPSPLAGAGDRARRVAPVRATPITFMDRRRVPQWLALAPPVDAARSERPGRGCAELPRRARRARSSTKSPSSHAPSAPAGRGGARRTRGARAGDLGQLRRACGRCWSRRASGSRWPARGAAAGCLPSTSPSGGRWALARRRAAEPSHERGRAAAAVEHAARTLLRRYGVVFWRLLAREPAGCRRGGTCCASIVGSRRAAKFAAAVSSPASPASNMRCPKRSGFCARCAGGRSPANGCRCPARTRSNLLGILTPGPRLAALTANRLIFRDGLPVAALAGGKAQFLADLEPAEKWEAEKRLVRSSARGMLADLA